MFKFDNGRLISRKRYLLSVQYVNMFRLIYINIYIYIYIYVNVYKCIMILYKLGRQLYGAGISSFTYSMKLNAKVKELLTRKNDG